MKSMPGAYGLVGIQLVLLCVLILWGIAVPCAAADLGTPTLSEPLQQEYFFDSERLTAKGEASSEPGDWEPQIGLSHIAREDEGDTGVMQTTHRIHGEAGGKLNLLDNVSLMAVARLPLYTYESRFVGSSTEEGNVTSDLLGKGKISWRSELGVNLGKGVDLNLFYDKSVFGRVGRPGLDEQEEKVGTRVIIRFK